MEEMNLTQPRSAVPQKTHRHVSKENMLLLYATKFLSCLLHSITMINSNDVNVLKFYVIIMYYNKEYRFSTWGDDINIPLKIKVVKRFD